ncbi:DUF6928 family protein [Kitasatospora cinereorecta]|uniref:DUF6928 family protein n=1 Tax=Kitasatospora cinereorecta TaxID=285560 RepID=A0ABW0VAF3_9ACTN
MGFKTAVLAYADGDVATCLRLARTAEAGRTIAMMKRLTPGRTVEPTSPARLWQGMCPPFGHSHAASFPHADIVCDQQLTSPRPSELPVRLVAASAGRRLVLHAMNSVVDWSAFAVWEDGRLVRSLSLSPDDGFIEDIGEPLPFEARYWAADRRAATVSWPDRAEDTDALPFHALRLGVDALRALCGLALDGPPEPADVDGAAIGLHGFLVRGPIAS